MDEIKNGNFPEPRSRQEMYLQDIIGELAKDSSAVSYTHLTLPTKA